MKVYTRRALRAHLLHSVAIGAVALGFSGQVLAQDNQDSDGGFTLEEILVTAQKRAKTLQDVPIAVSAYTGETLEKSNIRDVRDLMMAVPAMNTTQAAASFQTVVNIRGIGTSGFNPGLEPSVGIYVDGIYRSRTGAAIGDFLSVERVEVLRGPQSTLFGKNTSAGVISFVTKSPEYEFGGKAEVSYGNYDQIILKGTVTGPIAEDKAAFRLSANVNKRDGFIENVSDGRDVNDRDRWAVRGQLLLEPSDAISFRLIGDYSEINEACCAAPFIEHGPTMAAVAALGFEIVPPDPYERKTAFNGVMLNAMKDFGVSGELKWDLGSAELTSISAYRDFESDANFDADFTQADLIKRNGELTKVDIFTQEIRLASTGDNRVDWLVGGFYSKQNLDATDKVPYGADNRDFFSILAGSDAFVPGFDNITGLELTLSALAGGGLWPAPVPVGTYFAEEGGMVQEKFDTASSSWAAFGQVDVHITDQLTLTGGLRYTKEQKDATGVFNIDDPFAALNFTDVFDANGAPDLGNVYNAIFLAQVLGAGVPFPTAMALLNQTISDPNFANPFGGFAALQFFPPRNDFDRSRSEDKLTGNVILAYDWNDDLNTYFSFSRGYKAGGFDTSRAAATSNAGDTNTYEFEPETVDAWELGAKIRFWDRRAQVNIAAYSQKVDDFQSNIFTGLGFELRNAGSIRIKGIEVDSQFALTENLNWTFAAAYSDATYTSFVGGPCRVTNPQPSCDPTNAAYTGAADLTGTRLADAPKWTMTSTATYTQPIGDNMLGFIQGEAYYRGERNVAGDLDPFGDMPSTFILNASIGIEGGEDNRWRLSAWAKNITNENYLQLIFDSVAQSGSYNGYPNDPRTYGLTLSLDF